MAGKAKNMHQASAVPKADNTIQWIEIYLVDSAIQGQRCTFLRGGG